jgi:hypothetical protein
MAEKTMWTLVRHSGFMKPGFERAVEEAAVTRKGDVEKIRKAGGLLFEDYTEASTREYSENYPPEVEGFYPHVRGRFTNLKIGGRALYVPESQA